MAFSGSWQRGREALPSRGAHQLKSQNNELWRQLCERAATEQDPTKLIGLVNEISRLLDEKFKRTERNPRHDTGRQ
jgi:hypothetical protein